LKCALIRGETIEKSYYRVNERIRAPQVRVIDDNGAQIGVLTSKEALALAQSKELDLIEVAPNASPPVCRIMDYGKYKYAQAKKEQEQRKKHKAGELKIIQLRPNISPHDLEIKAKHAQEFLGDGDKVRLTLKFRSREMSHPEIGRKVLARVAELVSEVGTPEAMPRIEGRTLTMILAPKAGEGVVAGAEKPKEKHPEKQAEKHIEKQTEPAPEAPTAPPES
jgi:translation initiation factor IF-3